MSRYDLSYKYSLDNGVNWIDITEIVDSSQTSIVHNLCTAGFKSATDTASFTIPASDTALKQNLVNALLGTASIMATIYEGATILFTGYVNKDNISIRSYPLTASISIELEDVSTLKLDDSVNAYIYLKGKTITEIVHALLDKAGYAYDNSSLLTVDEKTIEAFVIDKDDSDSYRDYIDTLLFEAGGYVLDFNASGVAQIVKIDWQASGTASVVDNPMISDGVTTKTSVLNEDGVSLKWASTKWSEDSNQLLWQDSISRSLDDGYVVGEDVENQRYWPDGGELSPVYQEYNSDLLDSDYLTNATRKQNSDLAIIVAEDVRAEIQATKNKVAFTDWKYPIIEDFIDDYELTTNPVAFPKKAWYLLYNESGATVNIQHFRLYGKVFYKDKQHTLKTKETKNPKEYESKYIYNETHANQFVQFYWHFMQTSRTSVSWKEVNSDRTLGDVVQIYHKGSLSTIKAVIAGITTTFVGRTKITSYTAVGVAAQIIPYPTLASTKLKGATNAENKGIHEIKVMYATSTTQEGTKSDWQSTIPTLSYSNRYLWQKETIYYTDGTSEDFIEIISVFGETGNGIKSITEYYATNNDSATVPADSEFKASTVPTISPTSRCLWNYKVVEYTDNTTKPTSKGVIGMYGDTGDPGKEGKGIKSITPWYLATDKKTGVTRTGTSGWTTTIQSVTVDLKYLWSYTETTYTEGDPSYNDAVIIGTYGDTGKDGEPGKDGSSVEVQYSYSPSADTCYDEFIQWSDSDVYWGTEQALWNTWLANSPAEKEGYYIWMRARIGTADWQYTRLTGVQAKLFNLKCSQSTLTRNQRRDEKAYVTIYAEIQGYINVVPTLKLNGSEVEMNYTEDSGYYYVFGYSLPSATTTTFTLYKGTELMDTLVLKVVDETAKACYFGVSDTAPTQLTNSESLLTGDWYLDKSSNIVRIYNGKTWEDMDADAFETGNFTNIEKVSVCLADMIKLGSDESVTATLYGVFKKLCADEAFIKQLKTYFLRVGQGDDTSGFYTQISDVDNAVTFVVKYNGSKVFEIDPASGDVNFGQSDSGEPIFRYDADTNSIRSIGDSLIIDSTGKIAAKNLAIGEGSTFSGTVTITDMLETRAESNNKTISTSNDGTTATGVSGSQIKANITKRAETLTASTPASDNSLSASGNVMGFSSFDKILRYANTNSGYERIKLFTGTDCETTETWTWQNTMPFAVKVLSSVDVKSAYHTVENTSYYWVKSGSSVETGVSVPSDSGDTSVDPTSESDTATEISNVSQISYKPPMYQWTETYYTAGSTTSSEDVYSYGGLYIYVNDSRVSTSSYTTISVPAGATIKLELTGVSDEWSGDVGMWTLKYRGKDYTTGVYLYKSDFSSVARLDTLSSAISSTVSNSLTVNGTVWLDCPLNVSTAWTYNSSYGAIYKLVRFAWNNTETGSATQFSSGAVAQYYDINNNINNAGTVQVITYTADKLTVAGSGDDIVLTVGQWVHSYTISITAVTAPAGVYSTNLMPIASTASVGSASNPWNEVHAQQVNAEGTSNKVYGAKFKGTALFNSTISASTSYSIADLTQYEWITVIADVSYTRGLATFHSSLYTLWNSATNRLVISSDSEYVSIYFTSATSFTVRDKSSSVSKLLIYGYK